jgi:spore maturation protein CgeB
LNINRSSMVDFGFSPPTRIFEAAGAAACLITDAWEGIEQFLEPGTEVLVARDGDEVAEHLQQLSPDRAVTIGRAARRRIFSEHTYGHRAQQLDAILTGRSVGIGRTHA